MTLLDALLDAMLLTNAVLGLVFAVYLLWPWRVA